MPGLRGTPAVTITTSDAGDIGIVIGADECPVIAFDRAGLGDVEAFALRQPADDVEQNNVAKFL